MGWDNGTVTGRIQCATPNISAVPKSRESRDRQESVWLYEKCREGQKLEGYKLCDDCHERFLCWTSCRPETFQFTTEDVTQLHIRINEMCKVMSKQGITVSQIQDTMCKSFCSKI